MTKQTVRVCHKGESYGVPGELIKVIKRKLWAEQIGNFNPIFCRYMGKRTLVKSEAGDLSDPFRREESYAETFYIEVEE